MVEVLTNRLEFPSGVTYQYDPETNVVTLTGNGGECPMLPELKSKPTLVIKGSITAPETVARLRLSQFGGVLDVSGIDISNSVSLDDVFNYARADKIIGLETWDTSNIVSAAYAFKSCRSVIDKHALSNWSMSNCTSMDRMFCDLLYQPFNLDISNWDVRNVTELIAMFEESYIACELDLSKWNLASVTNMARMFMRVAAPPVKLHGERAHAKIKLPQLPDDTSGIDMEKVFACARIDELDLTGWKYSAKTNVRSIFYALNTNVIKGGEFSKHMERNYGECFRDAYRLGA